MRAGDFNFFLLFLSYRASNFANFLTAIRVSGDNREGKGAEGGQEVKKRDSKRLS